MCALHSRHPGRDPARFGERAGGGGNVDLLLWYGATLCLRIVQRGKPVREIDLHRYVTIRIEGYPDITLSGRKSVRGYDFSDDEEVERIVEGLQTGDLAHTASVAWERIRVPALRGEVAIEGDFVDIRGNWALEGAEAPVTRQDLRDNGYIPYGGTDLEI